MFDKANFPRLTLAYLLKLDIRYKCGDLGDINLYLLFALYMNIGLYIGV